MQASDCSECGERVEDIIDVVLHSCNDVLTYDHLTASEENTLMYVEERMVNHHGDLDHEQMNHEDQQNRKVFSAAGLLDWEDFEVTKFSDKAWELAMECRKHRAERMIKDDL